jgi:HEAT repeat protein
MFFDPDDMTEIQKYGPRAVPVLAKFLLNRNARIERVAIRLLGAIGGPAIADPLVEVLDKSSNSNLKQAPCSKAVARAILRAAKSDPDSLVRRQAQEESRSCRM